ncbi:MAG: aldehyde dehydrogenase [Clostridia bacterium]|nr:aldehyde dehydrogenase [Clostridia bacterium]
MTIHELVELQRRAFYAVNPRCIESRLDQLERLYKTIVQWEDRICLALQMDLGKSHEEAYMTEIGIVLSEISCFLKHLPRWARQKRQPLPLSLFPGKSYVLKEPYGVVLIMAPWNYPFQLTLNPLVGAIAAGNHCVVKPSAYAPATAQVIADLVASCFPPEQAAVILGSRTENQALLEERFDYIFFTGGVNMGKVVLEKAARYVTPVTLELGGKSPCIVEESADIATAARRIAFGKALNSGQTCVAPDYLLVQERVKDKLLSQIKTCWDDFYGGALVSPQWPKMVNVKHYQRVMNLIQGETVYCGGQGDGARFEPTILTDVSWDSPIMQEEIFGPVLPVITFKTINEIIPLINRRERPLALYLFTRRIAVKELVLKTVPFGGGCVNDTVVHLSSNRLPFGGVGQSGMGSYHGKYSFDTFTHEKSVVMKGNWPDIKMRYPPYSKKKLGLIKKFLR